MTTILQPKASKPKQVAICYGLACVCSRHAALKTRQIRRAAIQVVTKSLMFRLRLEELPSASEQAARAAEAELKKIGCVCCYLEVDEFKTICRN